MVKYHQFRSVVVDSNPAVATLLETASKVKHRENVEKLKSLVDCIVFREKKKRFSARSPQ